MRFALLLASILFAGWRARHISGLFLYFAMQAVYTVLTELAFIWYGTASDAYAIVYATGTGLILVVIAGVVYEVVSTKQNSFHGMGLSIAVAVCTSHWLYGYLGHEANYKEMIQIAEATVLIWAGLILGGTCFYVERKAVSAVLALLWLALAAFRWGFVLHTSEAKWLSANWRVPGWLCVLAFTIVGLLVSPLPIHARR